MLEKLLLMAGLTTPLCKTDEISRWENRPFTTIWPENQQKSTKATEVKKTIKKKPKRFRTAFTTEQLRTLEKVFNSNKYIDKEKRGQLAAILNMDDKCIKVWFQNRRMKEKRSSESSCDTSIESYSVAGSPLANFPIEFDVKVKEEEVESFNSMHTAQANSYNAEPHCQLPESQYQLPNYYYSNYNQYYGGSNNIPQNSSFYYDTNVYPTQYYPNSGYFTEQCVQPQHWATDLNQINYD